MNLFLSLTPEQGDWIRKAAATLGVGTDAVVLMLMELGAPELTRKMHGVPPPPQKLRLVR